MKRAPTHKCLSSASVIPFPSNPKVTQCSLTCSSDTTRKPSPLLLTMGSIGMWLQVFCAKPRNRLLRLRSPLPSLIYQRNERRLNGRRDRQDKTGNKGFILPLLNVDPEMRAPAGFA